MSSTFRDLLGARAPRPPAFRDKRGALLAAAGAAEERFAAVIDGIVDRLLDTLFKHAESKLGSEEQRRTLIAYSSIYENRRDFDAGIQQHLKARLRAAVDDFLDNRLTRPGTQTVPVVNELSLVEPGEMERQVLAGSLGARIENGFHEAYRELNARLATLAGLSEISTGSNPFRPEIVVVAIDDAWRALCPDPASDLLILQRLTTTVIGDLGPFVGAANKALGDAGCEPTRATGMPVDGGARAPGGGAAEAGTPTLPDAARTGAHAEPLPHRTGVFKRIAEALARQMGRRAGPPSVPREAAAHAPTPPQAEIPADMADPGIRRAAAEALASIVPGPALARPVGALSVLQRAQIEQPSAFGRAMMVEPALAGDGTPLGSNYMDPMSPVDVVLQTPLRFVNVIRSIADSDIGKRADQVDAVVIELVARLFDFVFEDKNLADAIKVLLSRLQIPVLKAAMLDTEFFERDDHPARRLVNALASIGLGWSEQDGRDDPLFRLIEHTVQHVLEEFQEDLSLFDRLADEVAGEAARLDAESQRAAMPEVEPVRERAIREEERIAAQRDARRAMEERLREVRTMPVVARFLRSAWAEYVGDLLVAGDGDGSAPLRNALDTADDLLWSVEPKTEPVDRRRLLVKIPPLERQLRSGMQRVATPPTDARGFMEALDERWAGAILGEPMPAVAEAPAAEPEREPDPYLQQVLALNPGAILEMTKDDGARFCYKLGWISQGQSRFLLTNRLNSAPLIVSGEHLAGRLAAGKLRIIDRGPLVDRAMNNILNALEEVRYPEAQAVF